MTFLCNASVARILFLLGLLTLGACAGFKPQPGPGTDPQGRYVALTQPIIAIGDTQEHEATGVPLVDNDNALDGFLEVTQRPPEQPLFGRRIMQWVFEAHRDLPFLHLGDVLDLSCKSEARRMHRLFETGPAQGALLPGNHDGLMFGIYGYNVLGAANDEGSTKWNAACRRGAEARLVDGDLYANSFIAQRLRLPAASGAPRGVVIIALDTNQAGQLVSTWDVLRGESPGSIGHVRLEQIRAITRWVNEAARAGDLVVFAGHHNWQSLGLPSRTLLRTLMSALPHPLVYLSAHTHRGFWAVHRALDRRPLLELNTSSLSDWPIAYRKISFAFDEKANRLMVRGDLMPSSPQPHRSDADLLAAWERDACSTTGHDASVLTRLDTELIARQRASRGSLLGLLRATLMPGCEACEIDRFQRASEYQDEMLTLLIQTGRDLGADAHQLDTVKLPEFCGTTSWSACAGTLLSTRVTEGAQVQMLYRRKAQLVDLLGRHLDDLEEPRAKAYMTCRAVLAAKIDFDQSADSANSHRGEDHRRAEQFFRVEATVGMD